MPTSSVAIVTSNANDTHIPSLCRLTNTQCNLPMDNQSRVNPGSYHSTLGLSDKYDRVFSLGQQNFSVTTAGLSHPCKTFSDRPIRVFYTHTGLLHPFGSFTPIRVFYSHSSLSHPCRTFRIIPWVSYTRVPGTPNTH